MKFFVASSRPWASSLHGLHSYLSNRQQIVEINGIRSDLMQFSCGVPQGSLLGPLLYLCYSNDMVTSVKNKLLLYADDSVIISSDSNPDMIARDLSLDLESCNNWLINNKLSLHVGKTELILFESRKQLKHATNFHVSYNGYDIQPVSSLKYLGVLSNWSTSVGSCYGWVYHKESYWQAEIFVQAFSQPETSQKSLFSLITVPPRLLLHLLVSWSVKIPSTKTANFPK